MLDYKDFYHLEVPAGPRRKILNQIAAVHGLTASPSTYLPKDYHPYTVIKNLITDEEMVAVREFFYSCEKPDSLVDASSYSHVVLDTRLNLPSLEKKLKGIFPDMKIFATNFFSGEAENGVYSTWHTGANLSKLFVGEPNTCTVWIPLQTLTAETGGRLWFYNSEYLNSVIDVLRITDKKTMGLQYLILQLLQKDLEANKITEDCAVGDAFMFWEINPHCVDLECKIKREVLSVRLVKNDAVVDEAFLKELVDLPDDEPVNLFETKNLLMRLHLFLEKTKKQFEESNEIIEANKQ
jgi:hypothetical protein